MTDAQETTPKATQENKPGFYTSEFWLTLLAVLLGAFVSSGILPDQHVALKIAGVAIAALASFGYTISRGKTKTPPGSAVVILVLLFGLCLPACATMAKIDQKAAAHTALVEVSKSIEAGYHSKCLKIGQDCGSAGDQACPELLQCQRLRSLALNALKLARHALVDLGQ